MAKFNQNTFNVKKGDRVEICPPVFRTLTVIQNMIVLQAADLPLDAVDNGVTVNDLLRIPFEYAEPFGGVHIAEPNSILSFEGKYFIIIDIPAEDSLIQDLFNDYLLRVPTKFLLKK